MNRLYDITNSFLQLTNKIESGELTEEEYNKLGEELAIEFKNKSVNVIAYLQNKEALIEAIETQIKRLQEFKKVQQNGLDRFYKYVKENMERLGVKKVETELGTISLGKNPMSVEIENEDDIPKEFKKEVTAIKIDKTAIKQHFLETGEIIPGIKIINNKTSLRIK